MPHLLTSSPFYLNNPSLQYPAGVCRSEPSEIQVIDCQRGPQSE